MRRPTAKTGKINVIDYNRNQDGAELANRQQLGTAPLSIPAPRSTDMIKCRNSSGVDLVSGNVLEIDDHEPTEDLTRRTMYFTGITPTGPSVPFGVLLRAIPNTDIGDLQCSGVCVALVNVTDATHRFGQTNASAVLQSAAIGPVELLWKPAGTGQAACLVRFGGEGAEAGRKFIDFELDAELTTAMASVAGTIVTEYGPGSEAPAAAVTLLNPMGQAFFGEAGARGLALWDHDETYVIIQLAQECLPEAPESYTLSIADIESWDCGGTQEANNYGDPMTLQRVGPYTWRHNYTLAGGTHIGPTSNNRVAFVAEGNSFADCEVTTEAYWEMRMAPDGTITVEYYIYGIGDWYEQWERYTWQLAGSGSREFNQSATSIPPTTRVSGQEGAGPSGSTFYALNHANSTLLLTAVP